MKNNDKYNIRKPQHIANILADYLYFIFQGNPIPTLLTEEDSSIKDNPEN